MNLEELLKDKTLPVKVRIPSWSSDEYFEVVSFNEYGAVGYIKNGDPYCWVFRITAPCELYQEPKQKTVLHEYLVSSFSSSIFVNYYLKSGEEFSKQFPGRPIIKTGRTIEVELP